MTSAGLCKFLGGVTNDITVTVTFSILPLQKREAVGEDVDGVDNKDVPIGRQETKASVVLPEPVLPTRIIRPLGFGEMLDRLFSSQGFS